MESRGSHHTARRMRPAPWSQFKARAGNRLLVPVYFADWACSNAAFILGRLSLIEVLEHIGSFSVLVAIVFWIAESGERTQQKHYQAWQVINTAQGKGGSGGRIDALQQLNDDRVPLTGVDVSNAFLQGVKLERAELRRADMNSADLRGARLARSLMQDANLQSANLREADLRGADLSRATLEDADLADAQLGGTRLSGVSLKSADLRGADLSGVLDWRAIASVRGANVAGVRNPPPGFLHWAMEGGAVQTAETSLPSTASNKMKDAESSK